MALSFRTLIWVGPNTNEEIYADFLDFFGKQAISEGDMFACLDTAVNITEARRELARKRGIHGGPLDDLKPFLTPGGQSRYDGYQQLLPRKRGARGSCIADIGQDPNKRPRIGAWIPTSTKSSKFVSLTKGGQYPEHVFTADELAFAHGWPCLEFSGNKSFRDAMPSELANLSQVQRQKVLGNGVHLVMLFAWNLYIESHVIRRDQVTGYVPRSCSVCVHLSMYVGMCCFVNVGMYFVCVD